MAFTRTWDAAYKALPADNEDASQGAQRIRHLKEDISERLEVDHSWAGDSNDGKHNQVTLIEQASDPANAANTGFTYTKDVGGVTELFYEDSSGNVTQITVGGNIEGASLDAVAASIITGFDDTAHGNRGGGALHADATTGTDGFMSAADKTKLDGIETGATADQSAADIRGLGFFDTSNDGTGSGLDADLLDGQHGSYYRDADNLNAGTLPAARFNDTAHGNRSGGSLHSAAVAGVSAGFISAADQSKLDGIEAGATADQTAADIRGLGFFDTSNDGSGSGLDADTVDGNHASAFSTTGHTHGQSTIDANSVGQSEIKQAVQTITSSNATITAVSKTGGRYCLGVTAAPAAGTGTDEFFFWDGVPNIAQGTILGGATGSVGGISSGDEYEAGKAGYDAYGRSESAYLHYRIGPADDNVSIYIPYINSSPPYDPFGLGQMFDFVYAVVDNTTGEIEQVCDAPDAPWVYNGPTPVHPAERLRKSLRIQLPTLYKNPTQQQIEDYRAALENSKRPTDEEIKAFMATPATQAEKNADMDLIPHPWIGNNFGPGGNMEGKTIVLIAGAMAEHLTLAKQAGDNIADILLNDYITLDNKNMAGASRHLSHGLLVEARWKLTS